MKKKKTTTTTMTSVKHFILYRRHPELYVVAGEWHKRRIAEDYRSVPWYKQEQTPAQPSTERLKRDTPH